MQNQMTQFLMPFIKEEKRTLVAGFLGKDMRAASLCAMPQHTVLKAYTDGDAIERETYQLAVRFPYGVSGTDRDIEQFFYRLAQYVKIHNREEDFPDLDENTLFVSVSCDVPDKIEKVHTDSCVCSAKIHLTYYKMNRKGRNE